MTQPLIQAINSDLPQEKLFLQAIQEIKDYSSWIEAQALPGFNEENNSLNTCKQHAINWFNTIYPEYLDMPKYLLSQGQQIESNLQILKQLSSQLQSNPSETIRSEIQQYATSLNTVMQAIQSKTNDLATALTNYLQGLKQDIPALSQDIQQVQAKMMNDQHNLSGLVGKLHHLQAQTCPDKNAISSCEKAIQQTQQQIQADQSALQLLQTAITKAQSAANGLSYLSQYWMVVSQDAQNCSLTLQNIDKAPALVLKLEIQSYEQHWQQLKQKYDLIDQQIAQGNLAVS